MNLDKRYRDVLDYLALPKGYDHSGDKTICYLTFDVGEIQYVRQCLNDTWIDIAKHKGINLLQLSLHDSLKDFFKKDEYRISAGEESAKDWNEMNEVFASLGENLKNQRIIEQAILLKQQEVKKVKNGMLLISDLEAIHPFTRFGPIEQNIYGEVEVPIIVLYPGIISGSALKYLGFYPEDGNYRSKHF